MNDDTRLEIALLKQQVSQIQEREARMRTELDEIKKLDERRMRAAVISLGAAVLAMGSYIWATFVGGPK